MVSTKKTCVSLCLCLTLLLSFGTEVAVSQCCFDLGGAALPILAAGAVVKLLQKHGNKHHHHGHSYGHHDLYEDQHGLYEGGHQLYDDIHGDGPHEDAVHHEEPEKDHYDADDKHERYYRKTRKQKRY